MANAKKCDVCGRYYDLYNVEKRMKGEEPNSIILARTDREGIMHSIYKFELCPDCLSAIRNYMDMLGMVKEFEGPRVVEKDDYSWCGNCEEE